MFCAHCFSGIQLVDFGPQNSSHPPLKPGFPAFRLSPRVSFGRRARLALRSAAPKPLRAAERGRHRRHHRELRGAGLHAAAGRGAHRRHDESGGGFGEGRKRGGEAEGSGSEKRSGGARRLSSGLEFGASFLFLLFLLVWVCFIWGSLGLGVWVSRAALLPLELCVKMSERNGPKWPERAALRLVSPCKRRLQKVRAEALLHCLGSKMGSFVPSVLWTLPSDTVGILVDVVRFSSPLLYNLELNYPDPVLETPVAFLGGLASPLGPNCECTAILAEVNVLLDECKVRRSENVAAEQGG